jgi:alcohol dehydrogenase class IV
MPMHAFEFFGVARIVFGRGKIAAAAEIAATLGRAPLVIHNSDALIERLIDLLTKSNLSPAVLRQRGEPTVAHIDAALAEARRANSDCVIGLGGGSAIDAAKAIAGLMTNGGSAIDYMEIVGKGKKISRPAAPWMAIPTTAGTGAEVTRNAVIGLPEKQFKASIRSEHLLARVALIDPELGITVSPPVTASSGMDALCQLIESFTSTGASPITDALALSGISLAAKNLLTAYRDGKNLDAREAMALAALLSGQTLASAGLGAVHGFAAALGANFPIPHGTICAALLPPVIAANVEALRALPSQQGGEALNRYAEIGRRLAIGGGVDTCASFTRDLVRDLAIPPLSQYGLTPQHIPEMVALARKTSSMRFNPVVLTDEALSKALSTANTPKS